MTAARDAEADLEALLRLWRTTHHPRVADAIDRVSDELFAAEGTRFLEDPKPPPTRRR